MLEAHAHRNARQRVLTSSVIKTLQLKQQTASTETKQTRASTV